MKLSTEHLVKKYGQRTVVNDVNIEVEQGEIVGLLGPNGAGKTTTFYMVVGLIKPYSGKVFLDKQDISDLPAPFTVPAPEAQATVSQRPPPGAGQLSGALSSKSVVVKCGHFTSSTGAFARRA